MSQVTRFEVDLITTTGGAAEGFTPPVTGKVTGLVWEPAQSGGITGAAIAVTAEDTGESILSVSSVSAAGTWYPRAPVCSTSGVALVFGTSHPICEPVAIAFGRVQIAITGGGNVKSGKMQVIVE